MGNSFVNITNRTRTMKLWSLFLVAVVFAQDGLEERKESDERGPRECQGQKLKDVNGVKWICSRKQVKKGGQDRQKKCRAKCGTKKETRSGVKKLTCKPDLGWVERKTETPYDFTNTYCS